MTNGLRIPEPPTHVLQEPDAGIMPMQGSIANLVISVATAADSIAPWGLNPRERDVQLRQFWPTESYFASGLFTVVSQYVAFGWTLSGPPRTVRIAQAVVNGFQLGRGPEELLTKVLIDYFCLYGRTSVTLGGARYGKKKAIQDIVNERDPGPVLSYEDGRLVERAITEWHKTPLGSQRRWIHLGAKFASPYGGVWATNDHPFRTPDGWKSAEDFKVGDKIVTGLPVPSAEQEQLLVGTLLGDASVHLTDGKSAVFRLTHCNEQNEWLELKRDAFAGFSWTPNKLHTNGCRQINSQSTPAALEAHSRWYEWRDGGWFKRLDREAIERCFSPLMLAAWYGDDGSHGSSWSQCYLATDGFDYEDVGWLVELLNERGFDCRLQETNCKARIVFRAEGARKLWGAVAKYVPACLRYKLPSAAEPFNAECWKLTPASGYVDEVVLFEDRPLKAGYNGTVKTVYGIGVEGTRCFMAGNLVSHNTQDNAAFLEIVRADNNDPRSPCVSLNHLDSYRCIRTGRREEPVIYIDIHGKYHRLRWFNVIDLSEMPSPVEEARGMQICALSRMLRAAQIMRDVLVIKQEKAAGRFIREIHLVSGVTKKFIEEAMSQKQLAADASGLMRYITPLIVASLDPTARVSKETINLASIPEDFDEEKATRSYIILMAMAFGVDPQSFAPLPGGGLGSGSEAKVLNMKSRAKGPALFMKRFERLMNFAGILPPTVVFKFGDQDIAEQQERTSLSKERALTREIMLRSGEITNEVARQMAVDSGDLAPDYLKMMGEPNATDEITVPATTPADYYEPGDVKPGKPGPDAPPSKPAETAGGNRPNNSNAERNTAPSQSQKRQPGGTS